MKNKFSSVFIILCLGYLIDYYDLSIFAVARTSILQDLNVPSSEIMSVSKLMFNAQALGIFIGGILSGIWGDKVSRVSAIRVGIFIYSSAIIINIFVKSIGLFAFFRFISGIGLAGELAASVTLLGELCNDENRGLIGNSIYFFGVLGGILSTIVASFFNWKILFIVGGIAGFILLFLRKYLVDSVIFISVKQNPLIPRGNLKLLFKPNSLLKILKFTFCLVPFWLMVFFVNFAPEIARGIGIYEKINLAYCLFLFFIGSLIGSILFVILGKYFKSHKIPIFYSFILMFICIIVLCLTGSYSANLFSSLYLPIGMSTGYLGLYMMLVAENFGTNQRSTGTAISSNLGRTSFILINLLIPFLIQYTNSTQIGSIIGTFSLLFIATICLFLTKDFYGKKIIYTE